MARYVLTRLIYAIPVLVVVSVLAFFFALSAPGDFIEDQIALEYETSHTALSLDERQRIYRRMADRYDRLSPAFYFTVTTANTPDTLHRIIRKAERDAARRLLQLSGNWTSVESYRTGVYQLSRLLTAHSDSIEWADEGLRQAEFLLLARNHERIEYLLSEMVDNGPSGYAEVDQTLANLATSLQEMTQEQGGTAKWLPAVHWHGVPNQYHSWIGGVLKGDFGVSVIDGRPATAKIRDAIKWTLRINIPVILLAFGISIPLGVALARRVNTRTDSVVSSALFAFYAIPSFWLATLCIVFLTTPEYGEWLDLFPTQGIGNFRYADSAVESFGILMSHLFLPIICLLLGSLAYLTRQMRNGILGEVGKDYIRMARAKGLSESRIYWKHAFRNALFPMITLVGSALPAAVSGSVIIEVLFNIPGMGRLLFDSVLAQDWSVAFVVVFLVSVLTVIGYILSDVLYKWANPVVRFNSRAS